MNQVIEGYPIEYVATVISRYIYEFKGVVVRVILPTTDKEIKLFEQAATVALGYYGL